MTRRNGQRTIWPKELKTPTVDADLQTQTFRLQQPAPVKQNITPRASLTLIDLFRKAE